MGKSERWVRMRADRETWKYRTAKNPRTGRRQPRYITAELPDDVRAALFLPPKEVKTTPEEVMPFDRYTEGERAAAYDRQSVIHLREELGISRAAFAARWSRGELELSAELVSRIGTFSESTLRRWERRYRQYGLAGLCPRYSAGERERGPGELTLEEKDKELIQAYYLLPQKPPLTVALSNIQRLHGRDIPYEPARRFVETIPKPVIIRYREGEKKYSDLVEPTVRRAYTDMASMEWVVSDHRTLDFLVTHKGKEFRPILTAVADMRSRKLIGWWIDENPSSHTILCALEMMGAEFGAAENILIDNGQDYRSKALTGSVETESIFADGVMKVEKREVEGLFAEMGTKIHYSTPYNGRSKPIERLFRDVADYFDRQFESYVGSNTVDRPVDVKRYYGRFNGKSKKEVHLTLEQVRTAFTNHARWWNANHSHGGRGMEGKTPDQVFQENLKKVRTIPKEMLRLLFSEKIPGRKVHSNGIKIEGIDYYSDRLYLYKGRKVNVRRPVREIGEIHLYSLKGQYLCSAYNPELAGRAATAMDLKTVKKARKSEKKQLVEHYGWLPSYQAFMPKMADHLINHLEEAGRITPPEAEEKVVGLDLPPEEKARMHRGEFTVVDKEGEKKPSKNIEMLY
ncbi:MAG: Mu transposase C-terminal domain-containing protein [Spirochaetaceae bacterium]|nr:Mu transposase C-terminal domain-containing protein [Spirochaetaceae bacterium]